MSKARRAYVNISYENINIMEDIGDDLKSFSYTDVASGESDSITITVKDRERKWMSGWMPDKGSHMSADILFKDWSCDGDNWDMYCGEFEVDDVSIQNNFIKINLNKTKSGKGKLYVYRSRKGIEVVE